MRSDGFTREVAGVAAGYVAIPLVTMIATVVATRLVEPTRILAEAGGVEPTRGWLWFLVGVTLAGAVVAGLICGAVSRTHRAVVILAGVVLTMGFVLALPILRDTGATPEAVSAGTGGGAAAEAFRAALAVRPPARWLLWKPVLSALLVWLAARPFLRRT